MKRITSFILLTAFFLTSCNKEDKPTKPMLKRAIPERKKPKSFTYSYIDTKELNLDSLQTQEMDVLIAVNRMDEVHLKKSDSILVPTDLTGDVEFYLPFPF